MPSSFPSANIFNLRACRPVSGQESGLNLPKCCDSAVNNSEDPVVLSTTSSRDAARQCRGSRGQVEPSVGGWDVGDVGGPDGVRRGRVELAVEDVFGDSHDAEEMPVGVSGRRRMCLALGSNCGSHCSGHRVSQGDRLLL